MINEKTFNKWFNIFVLAGMAACVVLATVLKISGGQGDSTLLIIAAIGALAGVASTVLSANGSIWNFLFGLIDVLFYSFILYLDWENNKGQLALHILYILPMEFIGFYRWRKIGLKKDTVKACRITKKKAYEYTALFIAIASFILTISNIINQKAGIENVSLAKMTLDAVITTANIVAFAMMANAYMEQWYLWIIVNIASIALWALTPVLNPGADYAVIPLIKYIFYMINSVNGVRIWLKLSKPEASCKSE